MKNFIKSIVILTFCIFIQNVSAQNIKCTIEGSVTGRDSKALILIRETEDPRFNGVKIAIIDSCFKHEFEVPDIERYNLIFEDELQRGSWRPIVFFPDNGKIKFTLHSSDDYEKNVISGGAINKESSDFEKQRMELFYPQFLIIENQTDSLYKLDKYFSDIAKDKLNKLKNAQNPDERNGLASEYNEFLQTNEAYTSEALYLRSKGDSVLRSMNDWQNIYIKSNMNIFSYSLLKQSLEIYSTRKNVVDIDFMREIYPSFSTQFPSHPYTNQIGEILNAISTIKVGSRFIDFTASTIEGKSMKISEEITGKIALLDLWASWCRPCRVRSISYIPIYEKFKNKGLTVIGVACEYKNTNAFKLALENDKYPWINLIELDNINNIWNKYNISGSGGCTYLIDQNGIILAVHPSPEELDKLLTEILK